MTKDEALKLCDYLECNDASMEAQCKAAAFIREALAQPVQGPDISRPKESDYTSHIAYTRALEAYCDTLTQPAQEPDDGFDLDGLKDAAYALEAILQRAGEGATVGHVIALLETLAQPAQPAQEPYEISTETLIYMTGVHDGKVLEREACATLCEEIGRELNCFRLAYKFVTQIRAKEKNT